MAITISQDTKESSTADRIQDIVEIEPNLLYRLFMTLKYERPPQFLYMGRVQPMYNEAEIQFIVRSIINQKGVQEFLYDTIVGDNTPTLDKIAQAVIKIQDRIFAYYYKSEIIRFRSLRDQAIQRLLFPWLKRFGGQARSWKSVHPKNDLDVIFEQLEGNTRELAKITTSLQKIETDFIDNVGFKSSDIAAARGPYVSARIALSKALENKHGVLDTGFLYLDLEDFFNKNNIDMFYADSVYLLFDSSAGDYQVTAQTLSEIIIEKQDLEIVNEVLEKYNLATSKIKVDWLASLLEKKNQYIENIAQNKTDKKIFRLGSENAKKIIAGMIRYADSIRPATEKKSIFG